MHLVIHAWKDLAHPLAGGSEQLVHHVATGLTERGHRVHLICGGPVEPRTYEVTAAGGTYGQYLRLPFVHRRRVRGADLVLDVSNGMSHCTPLWGRVPTILLFHHLHTDQWSEFFSPPVAAFGRWFEGRLVPRVYRHSLVIAVSPSTASDLTRIGIPATHIRQLTQAVDPVEDRKVPVAAEPTFVALGRLAPHKRVDLLLRMWEQVRPVVGGRLVIVGDGPEASNLMAAAGDGVEFLGRVDGDTKARVLSESWLLVHAASREGWGIAITEAAVRGTPSLGFDVAGVRDAIRRGVTGHLASDEEDFVKTWIELAQDGPRRAQLGAAAQEFAASMTADATVTRFEEIALEALGGGPPR